MSLENLNAAGPADPSMNKPLPLKSANKSKDAESKASLEETKAVKTQIW